MKSPVLIHRAILGSIERMMAVLMEHTAGKWPFWLSPRQCVVIPVHADYNNYAKRASACVAVMNELIFQVVEEIIASGFYADLDANDSKKLSKKVREAQLAQYNYILIVGEEEATSNSINVRVRDGQLRGQKSVTELIKEFHELTKQFR